MRVVRVRTVVYLRYNGRMTVRLIQRILEVNVFIIRRREESPEVVPREAHATDLEDAVVFPIIIAVEAHAVFDQIDKSVYSIIIDTRHRQKWARVEV